MSRRLSFALEKPAAQGPTCVPLCPGVAAGVQRESQGRVPWCPWVSRALGLMDLEWGLLYWVQGGDSEATGVGHA